MRALPSWLLALSVAACAGPDDAGRQVGRALYGASVDTGHAIAVATDRTGRAFQDAGTSLRNAVSPPPPLPAGPPALPPPYVPDGFPAPVSATPLPSPPAATTLPDPAMGY